MDISTNQKTALIEKLLLEKKTAREFQERKHTDWNENYELYRNKVKTNRLTQRQAVNIPLMKETVKTLLSKVDDPPTVDWQERGGDEMKELIFQEIWNDQFKTQKFAWKDVLDKKNVLLYGQSTKKLNIMDGGIAVDVLDVWDVIFDPLTDPLDIEKARFIIHQNIFRSLREILADDRYSKEGKDKIKSWVNSKEGILQTGQNKEEWEKKVERIKSMGVDSSDFPHFAGGDVIVNLTEHYTNVWNTKTKAFERRVVVYADDATELLNETLFDLIGVDFWPFVNWSEDPETNDIYPDSVADLVRTPNKVLNVWFSQLVENRTLRNFQMHWYDATIQGYTPQTYEPGPGVMLPAPGDPNKTIMPVNIDGLDETMNAIHFITTIVERGTGATAIDKGQAEEGAQTLGEVEILVGKATERAIGMATFYRASWEELANKWERILHTNPPKKLKLYKAGVSGRIYEKVVYPSDWVSKQGYSAQVASTSEQDRDNTQSIQKWMFILQQFPDNPVLRRIGQKRMIEIVDLTPEEMKEIQEAEEKKIEMMEQQQMNPQQVQPQPQMEEQQMATDIMGQAQQLTQM